MLKAEWSNVLPLTSPADDFNHLLKCKQKLKLAFYTKYFSFVASQNAILVSNLTFTIYTDLYFVLREKKNTF